MVKFSRGMATGILSGSSYIGKKKGGGLRIQKYLNQMHKNTSLIQHTPEMLTADKGLEGY